ncbi:RNA-binding protein [Quillaja saponaria]|uniref:RNA-binding protein n=1 Tax=Quillaja saponaria TaxID=32244 RepID=A0AAD7LVW1_QUISA|nr:RNA-binding protein [Quillaja saponaria]
MSDAYWRYGDARQMPSSAMSSLIGKRLRAEYDLSGGHDLPNYFPHDEDRGPLRVIRDTESIGASYDRYLRTAQVSSYSGGPSARPIGGGISGHSVDDPRLVDVVGVEPRTTAKDKTMEFSSGSAEWPLPSGATNTLYVEGLPSNCKRREVAHIFRPFVGYKEVRLVIKESKHPGGDPLVLCFVDFVSPAHAATAMDALQGYKFDEDNRDSVNLRLQFARYPGARSGARHRGKR